MIQVSDLGDAAAQIFLTAARAMCDTQTGDSVGWGRCGIDLTVWRMEYDV